MIYISPFVCLLGLCWYGQHQIPKCLSSVAICIFYFALKCGQCNQMHQSGIECGIEYGRCIWHTLIYTHSVYIYT